MTQSDPMKKFTLLTAIFVSVVFAIPQQVDSMPVQDEVNVQASESIEIPFAWKVGDQRRYSVSRIDYKDGVAGPTKKSNFFIEVESDEPEYIIAKCKISMVLNSKQRATINSDPVMREMVNLYRNLVIRVRIGKDGVLDRVVNVNDLTKAFQVTVDTVKATVAEMNLDAEKKAAAEKLMKVTLDYQRFEGELMAPLNLLLMLTNTEHSTKEPSTYETTTQGFFANDIPAVETYQVSKINRQSTKVDIEYSQTAQGPEAAKKVKAAVEKFIKQLDPDATPNIVVKGVVSEIKGKFQLDFESGWPTLIEWKTRTNNLKDGTLLNKQTFLISEQRSR